MKIIVPMAGIGSRLRPHTLTIPKPLTKIAGKPIVQRLVEDITAVVNQKIDEIVFIIGPTFPKGTKERLLKIAETLNTKGSVEIQHEALGTAHAIYCAEKALNGPCVVAFADTLFKANFSLDDQADGAIWVKQVADPSAFGVVKLDNGIITDFVEKPKDFVSDLAIIGIYYFKEAALLRDEIKFLLDNDLKEHGEYQLTNALEALKQKGLKFVPGEVNAWMDCGNKPVTLETNTRVLQFAQKAGENLVSNAVKLDNSTIIPPCFIGKNVVLTNSTIGPNVSLGDNSCVTDSTVTESLIQENTTIKNAQLNKAMIGNNVVYNGNFTEVSLGDYCVLK